MIVPESFFEDDDDKKDSVRNLAQSIIFGTTLHIDHNTSTMALTTLLARDMMRTPMLRPVQQHVDRQVRRLTQTAALTTNGTQRGTTGQILTRIPTASRNTIHLQLPMAAFTSSMPSQRATFVSQSLPVMQSSPFDPQSRADPSSDSTNTVTTTKKKRTKKKFIPRKAAVELNDKTRYVTRESIDVHPFSLCRRH
jgi:hypothetical protein